MYLFKKSIHFILLVAAFVSVPISRAIKSRFTTRNIVLVSLKVSDANLSFMSIFIGSE